MHLDTVLFCTILIVLETLVNYTAKSQLYCIQPQSMIQLYPSPDSAITMLKRPPSSIKLSS